MAGPAIATNLITCWEIAELFWRYDSISCFRYCAKAS